MEEVRQWQNRPLEALYPILYVDCLVVKVRENQRVINKAVYLVLGVTMEGQKELLGMWMSENEGAKFWLTVFTELHNRDTRDCFIACVDGLASLPEAIEAVLTRDTGATVHGPPGAQLPQVCFLQAPQSGGCRPASHLLSSYRGRG